ncbi:hypothetical protein [Halobellus limi]|uniref:DUF8053 domain-containing protein n=1 Tax=Halobellus limi TaxID=699433 RepID=A0A1H5SR92_9EURY|nr:hypothetical protein [Halobellus limi]QCC47528.1 hypothetical protein DV707_07555 [Halobellus limi]SEF52361.1 hypothetical protein SAMN04488133_0035 [Halobellus limi]
MQKLRDDNGSGLVTIPKNFLERDDVFDDDGEVPDEQNLTVDRLGERTYVVRLVDDGHYPDLIECEEIERLAAQRILQIDSLARDLRAD